MSDSAERAARRFERYYKTQQPTWTLGSVHVDRLAEIIREEIARYSAEPKGEGK